MVAVVFCAIPPKVALAQLGSVILDNGACDIEPYYEVEAFDEPMQFFHAKSKGNNSFSNWIAAVGVITADTPNAFREFMLNLEFPENTLIFHSPGGNLAAGLDLGREIRAKEISTRIGRTVRLDMELDHPCRSWVDFVLDGTCASSCGYAFFGGVDRFVDSRPYFNTVRSVLGFHQFWKDPEGSGMLTQSEVNALEGTTLSAAQVLTGQIVLYTMDMGVDPRIVTLANSAGADDLFLPTPDDLAKLRIITNAGLENWFLEPYGAGLVAAVRGGNKTSLFRQVTAFCSASDSSQASLLIATDIEPQYPDLDVLPLRALEIIIDGEATAVARQELTLRVSNGKLNITAPLSPFQRERLLEARHIKFNLDAANAMGNFFVEGDLDTNERKMLSLAWRNCV